MKLRMLFWNDKQQAEMKAWITCLQKLGVKYQITEFHKITQVKVLH